MGNFGRPPSSGGRRIIFIGPEFARANNNSYSQYQERYQHGSKQLWDEVISNQGCVDVYTAKQFVESFEKGLFSQNPNINDPKASSSLDSIGFETAVNLFESLSERPIQGMSLYLDRLNRAMGLDEDYYKERGKHVGRFFEAHNTAFIEKQWEQAKKDGTIAKTETTFSKAMSDAFNNPEMVSRGDFLRRRALLQFISDAYSTFINEPKVEVKLINGPSELGGYNAKDEKTGKQVIGININNFAFQKNFQSALNILMHERHHSSQNHLADMLHEGKIKKGDDLYVASRVAAANMKPHGYIRPDYMAGPLAYRDQPIEAEANYAGKVAEYQSHKTYATAPQPIVSIRQTSKDNIAAKGYEDLVQDWKYGQPQGGGPVLKPRNRRSGFSFG
jgi:hypothetical protein